MPFVKEIHELNEKLGQPGEERLAELNEKYGNRLNGIANRSLQAGYALARKPYAKVLHIAQFENSVEIEDSEVARRALAIMKGDPEAIAALEAELKAAEDERAAIETDTEIDKAFKAYLAMIRELAGLLGGVKGNASAKEAAPKALELVKKWESKAEALDAFGPALGNISQKLHEEMKNDMGALVMTVVQLNGNKALSEPLNDVLQRIMKVFAGV